MNKITCPCCGYRTLDSDGSYDICPICFWEDDPFQKENEYDLGANHVPLVEAQKNYIRYGACEKRFVKNVRKSNEQDKRNPNWKAFKDDLYELGLVCRRFKEGVYNIADLEHNLSLIDSSKEINKIIEQAMNDIEMIRFCTSDYKQRDEAIEVVEKLLKRLNITTIET
ncbi:hypothetical protein J2D69_11195 [Lysinibacillus sphaericus]|nr:membrane protein [Lysinibacillus sphaericus CBAM5]MBE5083276.1 hypothetical protein [Bacillus thuringiensis]QPA51885.1 hypothetical protein INQ54_10500 [Lysinibacillus sphaericus]QPA56413.1 hypothetical protein INQ53_10715 [Lysinibacillus sphaericus]QTB20118.1 hypothetical protein J2D69_11195 [Lysinibacillus sphaericus]